LTNVSKGVSQESKLPVMVYLHGGAFYSGTNDIDRIRGRNTARHRAILNT
jgi:carboxylesterase type B